MDPFNTTYSSYLLNCLINVGSNLEFGIQVIPDPIAQDITGQIFLAEVKTSMTPLTLRNDGQNYPKFVGVPSHNSWQGM